MPAMPLQTIVGKCQQTNLEEYGDEPGTCHSVLLATSKLRIVFTDSQEQGDKL